MTDPWLQLTLSNLCVSTALAVVAWTVQRTHRSSWLAHVLWSLALLKLLTPPVFHVPVLPLAGGSVPAVQPSSAAADLLSGLVHRSAVGPVAPAVGDTRWISGTRELWVAWLLGSTLVAGWSLCRVLRFHRLLVRAARPVPASVQELARQIATELGLHRTPKILEAQARISPFAWWIGGATHIVLPQCWVATAPRDELRMVIAHELAHLRRRDHWVRWIEWAASVVFWWNPVVWWARRNLRRNEELACDLLVLETLDPDRRGYARALLRVAEILSTEAIRPPAAASPLSSGGTLERRLTMILSHHVTHAPRWLRSTVVAAAAGILPLSIVHAQDFHAVERRLGGAVAAGEITLQQAATMMEALRHGTQARGHGAQRDRLTEAKRLQDAELQLAQARDKLTAMQRKLLEQEKRARLDNGAAHQHLLEAQRKLEAAVKLGKLSKSEAKEKLLAARKKLVEQERDTVAELRAADRLRRDVESADKKRYFQMVREKIESAVRGGHLSREVADRKLREARTKLFGKEGTESRGDPSRRTR